MSSRDIRRLFISPSRARAVQRSSARSMRPLLERRRTVLRFQVILPLSMAARRLCQRVAVMPNDGSSQSLGQGTPVINLLPDVLKRDRRVSEITTHSHEMKPPAIRVFRICEFGHSVTIREIAVEIACIFSLL